MLRRAAASGGSASLSSRPDGSVRKTWREPRRQPRRPPSERPEDVPAQGRERILRPHAAEPHAIHEDQKHHSRSPGDGLASGVRRLQAPRDCMGSAGLDLERCVAVLGASGNAGQDAVRLGAAVRGLLERSEVATDAAEAFCAWVGARVESLDVAVLDGLAARDLAIAWGCCQGHAEALASFERDVLPAARAALGRMRADDAAIDEQLQVLRTHVLVGGEGGKPRLAEYRGTGGLRRWVRAVAVRQYLNSLRGRRNETLVDDESALDALALHGDADPELRLLKARFREAFGAAFAEAARGLPPLERAVLRYTFVDGLGLDALGKALRVSRATAHRRLVDARAALLAGTERALQQRLGLTAEEIGSLYRLIRSQVEVSLRGVFASDLGAGGGSHA